MYRALDADKIIATIERLKRRIDERFHGAGLAGVAGDLLAAARDTEQKAAALARPNPLIQATVGFVIAVFLGLIAFALINVPAPTNTEATNILQTLEAAANLVVLTGAILIFLITLQRRLGGTRRLRPCISFVRSSMSSTCTSSPKTRASCSAGSTTRPLRPSGR
jgi:hypothetical protein